VKGKDANEIQALDEIFHSPLKQVSALTVAEINTEKGRWKCDGFTGKADADGVVCTTETHTNKDVPFGVVTYRYKKDRQRNNQSEGKRTMEWRLVDFGKKCELAADPHDSHRLFAASLIHTPESIVPGLPGRLANVAGFSSHDGGQSWTRAFNLVADTVNPDSSQRESYFDPTVCWGQDGFAHFAVMHGKGFEPFVPKKAGDMPPRKDWRVDFWKSDDAGVSWKQRSSIPFFLDRPFTVVDTTSGPRTGRQYTIAQDTRVRIFANEDDDLQGSQVQTTHCFGRVAMTRTGRSYVNCFRD
jgi:hypothetical protein